MSAMKVAEAARRAACSPQEIHRAIQAGELAATTIGKPDALRRSWRVLDSDLDEWLQSRRNQPAAHPLVAGLSARSRKHLRSV